MDPVRFSHPFDLVHEAEAFLGEVSATTAERSKKAIASADGLQVFLLFVRAKCRVPDHRVNGPITVQTLIGHAQMMAEGNSYELPQGSIISFAADVVHDVSAVADSVLLVTRALAQGAAK